MINRGIALERGWRGTGGDDRIGREEDRVSFSSCSSRGSSASACSMSIDVEMRRRFGLRSRSM